MRDQITAYLGKLEADRSAEAGCMAFAAQDDIMLTGGAEELSRIAGEILGHLNCLALCVARPSLPFADFLLRRTAPHESVLIPHDTETRTFLHDIPFLRRDQLRDDGASAIARLLASRKGVIVEGLGIVATGTLTIEQAYINWSSVFHSTFIHYLKDLLHTGFILTEEMNAFRNFRNCWLSPLTVDGLEFRGGPLQHKMEILDEICRVGRYTVQRGLVDSFFGNISYSDGDLIYISQTASSLDTLEGCIDPVPFENSSTVGITASSELAAHRQIFVATGCRSILHGHPRFAVIMSMLCDDADGCQVKDCWRDCPKVRFLGGTPVVAGEIGAGGLAKNVPPVIGEPGRAIVYGHGVFSIGRNDFKEAFQALVDVENWCRNEYFKRFDQLWQT